MDPRRFGPASVQYDDYHGTVALDNPDHVDALAELAGIDLEEWTIVGIDVAGGYEHSWASVIAVNRGTVAKFPGWKHMAAEYDGAIPATRFNLKADGFELLRQFKRWSLHATRREALFEPGIDLLITDEVIPFEDEEGT